MPVEFTPSEAIELLKYGFFTLLGFDLTIPAAQASPTKEESKAVITRASVRDGWWVLTERFNWGGTHRPNKVAYELWYEKGFYCGGNIRESNVDNVCTHLYSAKFIDVKLWNITSPAADVYVDFCVWYYTYDKQYHDKVMGILMQVPVTLTQILGVLKKLPRL